MARPERYDPEQWEKMNEPGSQQKIRSLLNGYLKSYLDSAPEGRELSRVRSVLMMLRHYFEGETRLAVEARDEESPRFLKAQVALGFLGATDFIQSGEEVETAHRTNLQEAEQMSLTPEDIEKWEEFKRRKLEKGEDWWE